MYSFFNNVIFLLSTLETVKMLLVSTSDGLK